ncbi:MAG: cupin domain-containing protein [Pseudonocardiaceae bacterium]
MIVSDIQGGLTRTIDDRTGEAVWRCLGRRGMLYSECESFDYVRLAPGAVLDERGREDIEEAWFVLRGNGEFLDDGGGSLPVQAGDFVLCPGAACGRWRSSADSSLELLLLAMMPTSVSERLPIRTPVA